MDTLVTLNFIGYAAVFGGGVVVGTLFGRNLASELASLVHSLESRVTALETALHPSGTSAKTAPAPAASAVKPHPEATEKPAAAVETHAAPKSAGNQTAGQA